MALARGLVSYVVDNLRMRIFVSTVVVAAAAAVPAIGRSYPIGDWIGVLVLCVLAAAAGSAYFQLPIAASVSPGFALTFAGIVYAGPLGGALVGLAGAVSAQDIQERRPVLLMVGNGAQLALAGALAGLVHVLVLSWEIPLGGGLAVGALAAPVLAASTFFLVNILLGGVGVSLKASTSLASVLRQIGLAPYWLSLLILALLGLVIAQLLTLGSWGGLVALFLPFMATYRTFRVYAELDEAFNETVRSLVRAIEAKDPYTRGHSERVAMFARRLAETLGLPPDQVALMERAALLHDVGKIGVALSTLTSPNPLTHDEFNLIRQHPGLGERLLQDVEFLAETAPIVRHHHERIDGGGYPDGLAGEDIPFLARILAAADSYDAMTTDRAYRQKMSHAEAITEMERVKGQQLDARAVDAFVLLPGPEAGA